jgi:ubiquinone/menaquinone biosynthesis C-methylase UbiE
MKNGDWIIQEQNAGNAFGKQAPVFDQRYGPDKIVQYKRKRVRDHVEQLIKPGSAILELNAGTGEDAVYFAQQGHRIHATDLSAGMLEILTQKVAEQGLSGQVTHEFCSYTSLESLYQKGPYDYLFSNFAGLNCTGSIEKVLSSFAMLVKPGGYVTLVILPRFCLWETLMLFRGKFRTAFRRWTGKKGAMAKVEGMPFRCWYYNPATIIRALQKDFDKVAIEGLCTVVPPSYLEQFADKHPRWFKRLTSWEQQLKSTWPWRSIGDYYIISLQRKQLT